MEEILRVEKVKKSSATGGVMSFMEAMKKARIDIRKGFRKGYIGKCELS